MVAHYVLRALIFVLILGVSLSLLQINQVSATACTNTVGFTQSQIVISPSGTIIVNPSDIVVNHSDWVEFCGYVPGGMTPFSSITVGTSQPLEFTMTQDQSTGMWYTPTIMFSNSTSCTPDVTLKIICASSGSTVNVSIIFRDVSNGQTSQYPTSSTAQVTDGGEGVNISTYTKSALFDNQLISCSTNPRAPGGAQGADSDKDGLCDSWEKNGSIEIKDSRINVANVPIPYVFTCEPGTCKPNKKDLFVEIDYMQGHKPSQMVIDHIRDALASGPVPGFTAANGQIVQQGVDVHIALDEAIPHKNCTLWPGENITPGFDQIKSNFYGTANERSQIVPGYTGNNWFHDQGWKLKRYAFHYVLVVDLQCGTNSTGIAEAWGNDVMISLGGSDSKIGAIDQQEGTIMHELGHNLGLGHGGGDETNCKPNELSVMSYSRQFSDIVSDRKLNFSAAQLGSNRPGSTSLDESNLIDADGLGNYVSTERTVYGPTNFYANTGTASVDWDNDPSTTSSNMPDLNRIVWKNDTVCDGSNIPNQPQLQGYNEWSILKFDGRGSANTYDGRPIGTTANGITEIHPSNSQHSNGCIALNSIPGRLKETAHANYRVCSSGRSMTSEESDWLNAKYIVDNLDIQIKKNPNIPDADKIRTLINDTNNLLQKNEINNAIGKISDFNKTYGNKIDPDIYQITSTSPDAVQNVVYTELTFENINSMRKIRIDTLEKLILDYANGAKKNQYTSMFQSIMSFIDSGDMNSAIQKLLEVRKTYDGDTENNLILTNDNDNDKKTRERLLQITDDILKSFGKAVNDPQLNSFDTSAATPPIGTTLPLGNTQTTGGVPPPPPPPPSPPSPMTMLIQSLIVSIGIAIAVGAYTVVSKKLPA